MTHGCTQRVNVAAPTYPARSHPLCRRLPTFAGGSAGNIQYDPYTAAIVSVEFLEILEVDCVEMFCEVLSDAAPCPKQFTSIGFVCRFSANLAIQRINLCEE